MNNTDMLEEMLKNTKTNRRGNKEIKFEVNSNYYTTILNLIAENKELKEEKREVISFCKKDLAFKKQLEKAKETIDDYNMGRFDTSESVLNILEG